MPKTDEVSSDRGNGTKAKKPSVGEQENATFEVEDGDVRLVLEISRAGTISESARKRVQDILETAFYEPLWETLQILNVIEIVPKAR